MFLEIYYVHAVVCCRPCDVRGIGFLAVAIHARCCFSIGLKRLSSWRFSGKGLF